MATSHVEDRRYYPRGVLTRPTPVRSNSGLDIESAFKGTAAACDRNDSLYVKVISHWYGVEENDEGAINPKRANVKIPDVLHSHARGFRSHSSRPCRLRRPRNPARGNGRLKMPQSQRLGDCKTFLLERGNLPTNFRDVFVLRIFLQNSLIKSASLIFLAEFPVVVGQRFPATCAALHGEF